MDHDCDACRRRDLDTSHYLLCDIDLDRGVFQAHGHFQRSDVLSPAVVGEYPISNFLSENITDYCVGRTIVRRDVRTNPRTASRYEVTYRPLDIRTTMGVPLLRRGVGWSCSA